MDETLNDAIDSLVRLRFETGGALLDHIVVLEGELRAERLRRREQLRGAGVPESQIGLSSPEDTARPEAGRLVECGRSFS
jgi:hypothetical protein